MSFFSSLTQYVANGVAGLGLSPRRFSLSRQDSTESPSGTPALGGSPSRSGSTGSTHVHGFPKVVPPPGTVSTPNSQGRRRTLETLVSPRQGSFRRPRQPQAPVDRPSLAFCRRRLSWPEVDQQSSSGVQETDGSYFESFTALAWQRENRRMAAMRAAESRCEGSPAADNEPRTEFRIPGKEKEQLYVEVLYTIANTVGAPAPGGQYAHYKEELYLQAQRAFGVSGERHYRLLHAAAEEKPPIVVLSVIVQEADGLEAKDANGFSDPYCMLGIQPVGGPPSPQPPPLTPRALSDTGGDHHDVQPPQHEKLRKHHSFRLSFKRKDGPRREHRDSVGAVPAKFIRATSVRPHTLNPKWNEKFRFDIDDVNSDLLHLDIWDHDDESCVLDAVTKLNEVRGVRGLGRFFKQVCQSARQGSQDDFLGCVNVPLQDIPSTGLEGWFRLEARSQRSSVQGRIRLKMWLSTREDRGTSEENNWTEVRKLERLHIVFMSHELSQFEGPSWSWSGELSGPALTVLHQSAVQGDLSDLQSLLAKWGAAVRLTMDTPLDPKYLHRLLAEVERLWPSGGAQAPRGQPLGNDQEQWLADTLNCFLERSLLQVKMHRELFPAMHAASLNRLEHLLRCLSLMAGMRSFRQVCPFGKGVRGEIVAALRKGATEWFRDALRDAKRSRDPLVELTTVLIADLQQGLTYYHALFETTNGIQYFSIVYKQFDSLLAEHVTAYLESEAACPSGAPNSLNTWGGLLDGDREPPDVRLLDLYLSLQEFSSLRQHLSAAASDRPLALYKFYEWFEPDIRRWLVVSKAKALQRMRAALQLSRVCEGERIVRHSTSAVDAAACFYQLREFWRLLMWPDQQQAVTLEMQLLEAVCSAALHYGDLLHQTLADSGYYDLPGPYRLGDSMCVAVNDLEYVRRAVTEMRPENDHPGCVLVDGAASQLEGRAIRVLSRLGPQMQGSLQKAVFHLAWSPDTLPTSQAIVPLLEYLDTHLSALNNALLPQNFRRALLEVWGAAVMQLGGQMDAGGDAGERSTVFHDRLHEALDLLREYFHAEGQGLNLEDLNSETFYHVEQRLLYHKTDTEHLIHIFYAQRLLEQQSSSSPGPYGILAVRAYFNHDSLCVEILHAKDVIPLDPNGFSDPFVIIEMLPRKVFPHCGEQQTNVHKKTLNPMFDECFEFSVTLEQCQADGAMIAFTVMDHDVLTANDFAGEAFLALGNIPGVADCSTSVDNFHGLKQVELSLMQQHDRHNPILQILESRVGDRLATEFVKKQKMRFASS